jgi:hypothetical protein
VGLRELGTDAAEYDVRILEVADSNRTVQEILERESRGRSRGTRVVGLDRG